MIPLTSARRACRRSPLHQTPLETSDLTCEHLRAGAFLSLSKSHKSSGKPPAIFPRPHLLINSFSGRASWRFYQISAPPPHTHTILPTTTTTDEKQCARFRSTANPISCFTLRRRLAERGDEGDGTGAVLTQIPQPTSSAGGTRRGVTGVEASGFRAISQSIDGSIRPHLGARGFGAAAPARPFSVYEFRSVFPLRGHAWEITKLPSALLGSNRNFFFFFFCCLKNILHA